MPLEQLRDPEDAPLAWLQVGDTFVPVTPVAGAMPRHWSIGTPQRPSGLLLEQLD